MAAKTLKRCSDEKQDNDLLSVDLAGKSWEAIVAYEIQYHRSCYRSYTRDDKQVAPKDEAVERVLEVIQKLVIENKETITQKRLQQIYNENSDDRDLFRPKQLLELVLEKFKEKISFWTPISGSSFLFNNELSKGEIISYYQKKLEEAEKRNYELREELIKEKDHIKLAAKMMREEINNTPMTYQNWPPTSIELIKNKTNLPNLVQSFLSNLLCYRPSRISKQKQVIITSIGQDMIYNVTNGKNRTSKHTILSLFIKRQTGSKILLKWLNKFGHGISYDETRYVETILAEDEVRNQLCRSYCPLTIQPLR